MYDSISPNLNFVEEEKKICKFWVDEKIFERSIDSRGKGAPYVFYDGPPTANGKPHIGHVLTRVIKDMIPRYRTMKGYMVPRKAGWDTHGLPVELEVEKLLGLDGKEQIEKYGLEPFIDHCKESVWKYKGMWEDFSKTVGFWADMDNPYVTYDNDFIESEWWALKKFTREIFSTKVLKLCHTAHVAEPLFRLTRLHKVIKMLRSAVPLCALRQSARTLISSHGPQLHGHFHQTLHSA